MSTPTATRPITSAGTHLAALVRAELHKLRGQRALRWTTFVVVALAIAMAFAMSAQDPAAVGSERSLAHLALFGGFSIVPYLSAFLASASVAGEFGSGVARAIYTAVPSRWPVVGAKALVSAGVGVGLAVASIVPATLVLLVARLVPPSTWAGHATTWVAVTGAMAGCAALALVGNAVGTICRRVSSGVVALVVLLLLAPPLLASASAAAPGAGDVVAWLPLSAVNALIDDPSLSEPGGPRSAAAGCLALWSVAAVLVSRTGIRRVDL